MNAALSRRAALSGALASVAMVGAGVAGAAVAAPAAHAAVSPELLRLIAAAKRANQASRVHDETVFSPAAKRRKNAVETAKASLRHITADAGEGMGGGRIELTTADPISVRMARGSIEMARKGKWNVDDGGEYLRAARRVSTAARWHERAIARVERAHDISADLARSNDLCNASADADYAVAGFTPCSLADLRCKLAFMVENDLGNGSDYLPDILADLRRLANTEASA